jgi:serine/threonine protein phosphatase PrpC
MVEGCARPIPMRSLVCPDTPEVAMEITFAYAQLGSPKHSIGDALCIAGGSLREERLMSVRDEGVTGGVYRHIDVRPRGAIYGVLDGVGGCRMPKRAAELAAETLREFVAPRATSSTGREGLREVWARANDAVHALGTESPASRPLGAAAASAIWISREPIDEGRYRAIVGNAGDTVAWLWDGDGLAEIGSAGSGAKVIRNYVGVGPGFHVDLHDLELEAGRHLVILASDGVTKAMGTPLVSATVRGRPDVERVARDIAFTARARGSTDDITVMAVQVTDGDG